MSTSTHIVALDDPAALDAAVVGAKAANLARARAARLPALPGLVLTTAWTPDERADAVAAWRDLSGGGATSVVVRSSSTGEDGDGSSMAGVFESVLDVTDEAAFQAALDTVLASADTAREAGLVDASMAVLVQPMLRPRWGGVLFGADPVTGRRDRMIVAAVAGGPDALVSGEVEGWTALLDRRGRVQEVRSGDQHPRPPADVLRRLAGLARAAARTYGGPQDIEWAVDHDGAVRLLQARPITTLAPTSGPVFGPGPVAETFPEPLSQLEQDLWLAPLRDGLREALRLTGTLPAKSLERSPIVVAVDGMAAADLHALGVDAATGGVFRRLDPRPPARRLQAAWRVDRLRSAFAELAADVVRRVDADLVAIPALGDLANHELLAVLRNARQSLTSLHGHEAIAGLLIPEAGQATVTGASLALSAVAQARAENVSFADLVERDPVVLALVPPRIGTRTGADPLAGMSPPASFAAAGATADPEPAAVAREALRLRVRWVQELTAQAALELARRLVTVRLLPTVDAVRLLTLDELARAAQQRIVPDDLAARREPTGRSLPARFRLDDAGTPWAAPAPTGRRRAATAASSTGAVGVSTGTATGPVVVGATVGDDIPAGSILVVAHLDPRLAPVIPRLGGLVAETGNALSHLAILAREYRVPTVVGVDQATTRFTAGDRVAVDGSTGEVTLVGPPTPAPSSDPSHLVTAGGAS